MSNRIDKYSDIDYSKDKFANEDFLDSLLFWIVLVILTIAYILWKNYPK